MTKRHCHLFRYGTALLAVLVAAFLARLLRPLTPTASPLFLAAVTVSALYGGLGPGLLAIVLSDLSLDYLSFSPLRSPGTVPAEAARLGVFSLVAVLITSVHVSRRRAEEALSLTLLGEQAALAEAEAANSHKDQFLRILGHELRTPLATIRTVVEVLSQRNADAAASDWGRCILERQVQRMSRLLEDLLDVSRISRGKIELRREQLDLARLLRATAEDHRRILEKPGLTFRVELPARPVWTMGDPTRLVQVVSNLLINAGKFTDSPGSISLRLTTTADGQEAEVTVHDSGLGIEPELLPQLFDPFMQAERTRQHSKGGLGLGLALVKGLVELHGGRVAASSPGVGQGAVFTVWLPLHLGPDQPSVAPSASSGRMPESCLP